MKQYFTGFFTGVCLVASAVMFMGATKGKVGRYQNFDDIRLLDTQTGNLYLSLSYPKSSKNHGKHYWYRTHGFKED